MSSKTYENPCGIMYVVDNWLSWLPEQDTARVAPNLLLQCEHYDDIIHHNKKSKK